MTEIEQFKTRFYDIDLSISDDGSYNMLFARLLFEGWQACAESKQAELDKANTRIAQLEELIDIAYDHLLGAGYEKNGGTLKKLSLAETSDTWLLEHDNAVEVRVLELVNSESKSWMDFPDVVSKLIESRKKR